MEKVIFEDWGHIKYQTAWDRQFERQKELIDRKQSAQPQTHHYFIFCEHPPVFTLGKSGSMEHLLLSETELNDQDIDFHKINRGGDITFHGKEQIVGYPIFDLNCFFTDIIKYIRLMEEAIIRTIAEYGIVGDRVEGYTGVWVKEEKTGMMRKICAIGVHLSRWVTMHGFALNVNTDLGFFQKIIPCGIQDQDKGVTSMAIELGVEKIEIAEVKEKIKQYFAEIYEFEYV